MNFTFPSLMSGLLVSSVGLFLFLYGKRAQRFLPLVIGVVMCVLPYFIPNLLVLWLVTAVLLVPVWVYRHA